MEEGLFEALCRTSRGVFLPIDRIANVPVSVNIACINCSHRQPNTYLHFTITSDWTEKCLFSTNVDNAEELKDLFTKIIPSLEYHKLTNRLFVNIGEDNTLAYQLLKLIPKCDNVVLQYQECSICLDNCITKTSCNHYICGVCEGNLTTKKCPICRDYYTHPANDEEE